jgi:cephalosporin-C deacetylase-like acetyl esterase
MGNKYKFGDQDKPYFVSFSVVHWPGVFARDVHRDILLGSLRDCRQKQGPGVSVAGGSQGGALSIITASLDPRVKWAAPVFPAMADMVGYLKGRAGGWPHIFDKNSPHHHTEAKIKTAAYYDVVNFARTLQVPSIYSMGFNDEVCPPTSMYAAYNAISSPKELKLYQETGYWTCPEESEAV